MLENIKMLLGISNEDTSKDNIINYYIKTITVKVLRYCKLESLIIDLEPFIENKVALILKSQNTNSDVKSIQRGDTTINYNDQKNQFELTELTTLEKEELDKYKIRKVKFI